MPEKEKKTNELFYDILTKYFGLIIFFVVILVLVLFYFFLINPKLQESVKEVQNNINFQQNIWDIERQKLSQMQESLDYFRQINNDDIELLESVIPHPYPKEKLFGEIEDIVLLNGYTLTNLSINEVELSSTSEEEEVEEDNKYENLQVLNISLEISGLDYNAMKRFLPVIENQLPLMDIVNLDFSPTAETLSLNIYSYYFKP
jgi:hypothetical protein